MPSFRERFEQLVAALRAHPRVEVLGAELRPPAPREAIARAEEATRYKLPPSLRAFYQAHDGAFLLWGIKGRSYPGTPEAFGFPDYGAPPGCINLLPVEEAMSPSWEEGSHVNEISDDQWELLFGAPPGEGVSVRAVLLDNFSRYHQGALILGPDPAAIVTTDHGADMEASDFMSFDAYLDCTLSVFGTNRYRAFGIGWSREPRRIDAWEARPSLAEALAEVEKDEG